MKQFGSGTLWATPIADALGAAYASPTPFQFGILQDIGIDASFSEKELYGKSAFPVDIARGKGKIGLKAKFANINILPFTAAFFGQSALKGLITTNEDQVGQAAAATISIAPGSGQTFFANLGVRSDANGTPMIRVAANPTSGQYTTDGAGVYNFAAADVTAGLTVFIDYQTMAVNAGQILTLENLPMGLTPTFSVAFSMQRQGKVWTMNWPRVTSSKLSLSTKQEDYVIPELDMSAIADDNGKVWVWSSSE